jgi:type II secretory pathway pseudopilin PulG
MVGGGKFGEFKTAGFSLPGVLVGVGLIGISATIISQIVINSRQTQKVAELKLSANKFQQAALDAVTERVKEFLLESCSGTRWGGTGLEVEKAFRELPITTESGVTTSLKFTNSATALDGHADVKTRCQNPVGPAVMGSGQYMSFCMEITPTGSRQIDYRLLELLIVPVNLASDQAIQCSQARGAAAGVKVTWQMFNQMDNGQVSGGASGKTVLKESGVFLVSAEGESYRGTCGITASRVGTTNQCTVNVKGLGRRPPTLFKIFGVNSVAVTGITWARGASADYDEFSATTTCETNQTTNFRAQSAAGGDFCDAIPVQPELNTCSLSNKRVGVQGNLACNAQWCNTWREVTLSKGIILPSDATNISLKVSDVHVDDWSPYISINGHWLVKYDEANLAPRTFTINKDISAWVKPGINVVYVGSWNKHTYWTTFFLVSGSYKTAGSCNHEFRYYNGTAWVSQNN